MVGGIVERMFSLKMILPAALLLLVQLGVRVEAFKTDNNIKGLFPANFRWGFATASYQIEGGWDSDGKGENIWDRFTHTPGNIADNSTGDVACDSYNKIQRDVEMLKDIGADYYRFSLSWSRILPNGTLAVINEAGIYYYNSLINLLIANNIEPMITLYHWDLPQPLQDMGGWPNETMVTHFENFARLAYQRFGDRVKLWITFNEAFVTCMHGYGYGAHAPGIRDEAEGPYQCAHTILKSHARAYRIYYDESFGSIQQGRVGITIDSGWYEPRNPNSEEDIAAADRAVRFKHGWFAWPIFFGHYPDVMRDYVDGKSQEEGLDYSRLPAFDRYWENQVKGSWDFLGLNHYTTELATPRMGTYPGWSQDQDIEFSQDLSWPASASTWLRSYPPGFGKLLRWIKDNYGNPLLYVTENGWSDTDAVGLNDDMRIAYYTNYTKSMLEAIEDGCNVQSYTAWSLMDNFEWAQGYTERFGVHWVNFTDPDRPRTPKRSAAFLKQLFADNGYPDEP